MRLLRIENFRHIDRNKAGGVAYLQCEEQIVKSEFIFYLQGNDCLGIRLGRHDNGVSTAELEEFLRENKTNLRAQMKPEVERIRRERREQKELSQA